jgi:predicted dehydrogenase
MAMRAGKHVYCQKPLAHSVYEARLMRETARAKRVCTQMGNQGTADSGFRSGVEIIRSGALGDVQEVHIWTNRPFKYWKQAPDIVARPPAMPVPSNIHWDLFVGPAPERPYSKGYTPHDWRGFWDFGTGSLGDMACHTANLTFMGLRLGLPTRVSALHGEINSETYPAWATITYEFPARGDLPPVKLTWYEGAKDGKRNLPPKNVFPDNSFQPSDSGALLVGSKWKLYSPNDYGARQMYWPAGKYVDLKIPEPTLPRLEGGRGIDDDQKAEWVAAIRAGKPEVALSNFDYASNLTEAMLLGNVAVRSGEVVDYEPVSGTISGNPKAAQYLKPYFRKGWEI